MKAKVFAANWKLNKGPKETKTFFKEFLPLIPQSLQQHIVFFVPSTNMESTAESLSGTSIRFGAQNCYSQASGAFTGEVSASVVREMGAQLILLGHSERRQIFKETDEFIAAKGTLVQSLGLVPMLCIGETLQERESNQTELVCEKQLDAFMKMISLSQEWMVAYEPVWAIGTGKVASLDQVSEAHAHIRKTILLKGGSAGVPILYGGSVKPDNAKQLLEIPEVGGFLVGGASLDPKSFQQICLF